MWISYLPKDSLKTVAPFESHWSRKHLLKSGVMASSLYIEVLQASLLSLNYPVFELITFECINDGFDN